MNENVGKKTIINYIIRMTIIPLISSRWCRNVTDSGIAALAEGCALLQVKIMKSLSIDTCDLI